MATDLAGYYESRPVITRLLVRRASRKANLSADDRQYLDQALRTHVDVVGQSLDDLDADNGVSKTAKLGDGTLLKLLIDNLPAIIAAIKEIIGMFPKAPAAALAEGEQSVFGDSASAGDAAFAIPPQLLMFVEPLAMAIAKAVWAYMQPQIDEFLRTRRGE